MTFDVDTDSLDARFPVRPQHTRRDISSGRREDAGYLKAPDKLLPSWTLRLS